MSKQLSIAMALAEKKTEEQKNCKHQFLSVPIYDFAHDEVYYFGICQRCGYKEE